MWEGEGVRGAYQVIKIAENKTSLTVYWMRILFVEVRDNV